MKQTITTGPVITATVADIISAIQHNAGIADLYTETIDRFFNLLLFNQDDLGMDNDESMELLRTLAMLRDDISGIREAATRLRSRNI